MWLAKQHMLLGGVWLVSLSLPILAARLVVLGLIHFHLNQDVMLVVLQRLLDGDVVVGRGGK